MTKHVPKEAGYYWCQMKKGMSSPEIVRVYTWPGLDGLYVLSSPGNLETHYPLSSALDSFDFLHAEPLTPPGE